MRLSQTAGSQAIDLLALAIFIKCLTYLRLDNVECLATEASPRDILSLQQIAIFELNFNSAVSRDRHLALKSDEKTELAVGESGLVPIDDDSRELLALYDR